MTRDLLRIFPDSTGIVPPDPFADAVGDPLHDVSACEVALFEHAHGRIRIERRDVVFPSHVALLAIVERSPGAAPRLEQHAEALMVVPELGRQFGTADAFREWWKWIGLHDRSALPADLAGYLRRLSLLREARRAALLAARAFEIQDPELAVDDLKRISAVLRQLREQQHVRAA